MERTNTTEAKLNEPINIYSPEAPSKNIRDSNGVNIHNMNKYLSNNWNKLIYLDNLLLEKEKINLIESKKKKIELQKNLLLDQIREKKEAQELVKKNEKNNELIIQRKIKMEEDNEKEKLRQLNEKFRIEKEMKLKQLFESQLKKSQEKSNNILEEKKYIEDIVRIHKSENKLLEDQRKETKKLRQKIDMENEMIINSHKLNKISQKEIEKQELMNKMKVYDKRVERTNPNINLKQDLLKSPEIFQNFKDSKIKGKIQNKSILIQQIPINKVKKSDFFNDDQEQILKENQRKLEIQNKIFLENQIEEKRKKKIHEKKEEYFYVDQFKKANQAFQIEENIYNKQVLENRKKYSDDVLKQIEERKKRKDSDMTNHEMKINKSLLEYVEQQIASNLNK